MSQSEFFELPLTVTLRVPMGAFVQAAPQPATVTQHTAEQHFGIPARRFKEMVRDGFFPVKRIGRLLFATYEDVRRAVTDGASLRAKMEEEVAAAVQAPDADAPMSVEAAQAYIAGARTQRERKEREAEVRSISYELTSAHSATTSDGAPNPKHDDVLADHGIRLLLASSGLRLLTNEEVAAKNAIKCCWCPNPAYATKQSWDPADGFWGGGPVCEACAKKRKPNERIVQPQGRKILLSATDPTVPAGWDAPRRRRRR